MPFTFIGSCDGMCQTGSYTLVLSAFLATFVIGATAQAFCGFYVAKADSNLFNEASQVVLVRDGDRTVITMANDFEGDVEDFAMVIPVRPVVSPRQFISDAEAVLEKVKLRQEGGGCIVTDREQLEAMDQEEAIRVRNAGR